MNPVRSLYLASASLLTLGLVLAWVDEEVYSSLLLIPAIVAAGAYTLSPQIMWWWWQRNPPDLPTELAPLLQRFDLYRTLDLEGKREFRRRTFLIKEATHLHGEAIDEFPEDVRIMVAGSAATVTFHRSEFLLDHFDTIIFYRHLFPSPLYDVLHSSEIHETDGAIIWTLNIFLRSVIEPLKFLQLGIYEYSKALFYTEPKLRTEMEATALSYAEIEAITQFGEDALKEFVGLELLDLAAITNTLYYTHSAKFGQLCPAKFERVHGLARRKVVPI